MPTMTQEIRRTIKLAQVGEITEYHIYRRIAQRLKKESDRDILLQIAEQEYAHYEIWTKVLKEPAKPFWLKVWWYSLLAIVLGYTFALKRMEQGENLAQTSYQALGPYAPQAIQIASEEEEHEKRLLGMLDEERLKHVGSMVLGLNDALVELTGAIAGLTFAFADSQLISLSALITGIAASLSMASSEYLSVKTENGPHALTSAVYTGIAYIITVTLLVAPYFLIPDQHFVSLGVMIGIVILIILGFNYYISVAQDQPFRKRFLQMITISLGVAVLSFGIGYLVNQIFGISV
jgi:VIT1/CCC1 family predicted Fe2+/Mn2+ transporter